MSSRRASEPDAIRRSDGVLVGVLNDQVVACDIVRHQAHIVDGLLAWLLLLDELTPFGALVGDLVATTHATEATATKDLREVVAQGTSLHLLDRSATPPALPRPSRVRPTDSARYQSLTYPVFGESVAFCCNDRQLIMEIDQVLSDGSTNADPTQWVSVSQTQSGEVMVRGPESLRFETRHNFLSTLVDVLNRVAACSPRSVAVEAGAVRTAAGDVWLLPGGAERENRTLIGALIQAGCDYLGADVIGIRDDALGAVRAVGYPTPLRLDTNSRELLGLDPSDSVFTGIPELREFAQLLHGEHGPIGRVLFCELAPDQPASVSRLDPAGAVTSLIACALNLPDAPSSSVQTFCNLAAGPPNLQIRYHDPWALAQVLVSNEPWEFQDDLDRQIRIQRRLHLPTTASWETSTQDRLKVRHSSDVASHDATIGGERTTFVIDQSGLTAWALTVLQRQIWRAAAAEDPHPLIELIRSEADRLGGSDEHSSQAVIEECASMVEQGLLVRDGAGVRPSLAIAPEGASPHDGALELRRYGESRSPTAPVDSREPWPDLSSEGHVIDWLGHLLLTDVESIRRILVKVRGASPAVAGSPDEVSGALIEVRAAPGPEGMMLIRLNGRRLWWASEEEALAVLGVVLANLASDQVPFGQSLGEISTITWRDRCLLHVGTLTSADQGVADRVALGRQAQLFGARVEHGKTVLLPDDARAVRWLADGANPDEVMDIWNPYTLAGILVEGAPDLVGGWLQTLTELSPWQPAGGRFLSELVANGDVPLAVVRHGEDPFVAAERLLVRDDEWEQPRANRSTTVRSERNAGDSISADAVLQSAAWNWATNLGKASWADESAKISRDHLILGRGVLLIRLIRPAEGDDDQPAAVLVKSVTDAIMELGLDIETSTEIALASVAAGNLAMGAELAGGHVRRKLYVRGIFDSVWAVMSYRWPRILTEGGATPSLLAWKWREDQPGELERVTYQGHLGHATSIGAQVDPILDMMGPDWIDVISHLLARLGIERSAVPAEGDLFTLDKAGRRSVDLSGVGSGRRWHDIEAEVRWLAAVANLSKDASDDLLAWGHGCRLSRLIFGTDRRNEPFVNLYVAKTQQQ